MARPIRNNTALGDIVYDPFLGSGTTIIAAESFGRVCFGLELSPAYCDIIVQRYKNYMDKNNKEYIIKKNGEILDV
jgi:DNA modification methylase